MMLAQMTFKNLNLSLTDSILAIAASLLASMMVYLMYHIFYGMRNVGAGVNRSFILGGPAITTLFLGIQSSIPLSLGLLGALSFVRFRTPVKDSAEIGFLLLLIASSIGIATGNYAIVLILFGVVLAALTVQHFCRNRFSFQRFANAMISMEKPVYDRISHDLETFLKNHLPGGEMKSLSVMDGQVSMHYQFMRKNSFDQMKIIGEFDQLGGEGQINLFFEG